ncbi:MAG TPA: endonuclease/exonuclease/phosphatase family protein [Gemmatimonas sp.]|nr:endonuclease/exonuclease/phosphatase family protein [Gemmatimonas sp.]
MLRILSYNIRFGGSGREASIAAVIRAAEPDVVVLQEASDPGVVETLSELTGMKYWGARAGYSTGYLSRTPVGHAWYHPRGARHAFLELVLPGDDGRIYGLHLNPWFSKWSEQRRAREIRALLESIREHQNGFHVIAGDFNALAPGAVLNTKHMPRWIQAMVWLSGRDIARDTIEVLLSAQYVDAWRVHHEKDDGYTFPTWNPHVRLDYVFTPERYQHRLLHCDVLRGDTEAKEASDHFPLLVHIDMAVASSRPVLMAD